MVLAAAIVLAVLAWLIWLLMSWSTGPVRRFPI